MSKEDALAVFENYSIRRSYDDKDENWYFSVIDVVAALTDSINPRDYWFKMKIRVKTDDGLQLSTICRQLKMKASMRPAWLKISTRGKRVGISQKKQDLNWSRKPAGA